MGAGQNWGLEPLDTHHSTCYGVLAMTTATLYARIRPELREAVSLAARENRRKIAAQVEVIIEEWLAAQLDHNANGKEVTVSPSF